MEPMKLNEASASDGTTDQSRREALKRFGRYAAAAPTAMMLLQPRESDAGRRNGKGSRRGNKGGRNKGGRNKGGRNKGGRGNSHY